MMKTFLWWLVVFSAIFFVVAIVAGTPLSILLFGLALIINLVNLKIHFYRR